MRKFYTYGSYESQIGLDRYVDVRLPHDNVKDYSMLNSSVVTNTWTQDMIAAHFNK